MLTVGKRGGKNFRLDGEQRSRHMHVIGASGTGKSKFLELMIRQDILAGRGICLIDPHGTLADDIVRFCASRNLDHYRRIHIIEPSDPDWCLGFNPLRADSATDPILRVDTMVDTCTGIWGGENVDEAPILSTCLQLVFYVLMTRQLTLAEAVALIRSSDPEGIRRVLTAKLPDFVYDAYWDDFRNLPRPEFEERFASAQRRLLRFLGNPTVRRIIGQRDRVLDLRHVMDKGDILIVNLAPRGALSAANARLLGALLISDFYLTAIGRTIEVGKRRPYYLYIDECYDYLTGDIEYMLDQTRKFGLHLVLAHHRLSQLRARSDAIYNGVMAGAQTKVVFGGLTDEDADIMAHEIMRNSFNLERPKHRLDRPVVVSDEIIWLESVGTGQSNSAGLTSSDTVSWNEQEASSTARVESFRVTHGDNALQNGLHVVDGNSSGTGTGGSSSTSEFTARTSTSTKGRHQALRSRYETRTTQVHSLDEEVHLAIVRLREQRNRSAIVKLRGQKAKGVLVPNVRAALVSPARIKEFRANAQAASMYLSRTVAADTEIAERHAKLGMKLYETSPKDDEEFRHEE